MTILTTNEVRGLYAAAVVYDENHMRATANANEFDDWLNSHDAETSRKTIEDLLADAEAYVETLGVGDGIRAQPSIEFIKERVDALAAAAKATAATE